MKIRKMNHSEPPPMNLLLLADPSIEFIKDYVNRGETYFAEINGEVVGVYILLATRPGTCEIINIAVSEKYQGEGIGRKLLEHAIELAFQGEYKTLEIGTGNSSIGQLAFYQKCGFRITGVDRDFFVRHYKEDIIENGIHCRDMIRLSMDLQ
ncbi:MULTISPECIES: GNAT family N-acetyltransferase [Bacillaceae]|jgi:ribosomal protein S18 acetylase RimI-like enzyme|uniref:GNAT family N-acetyltransferase n=1 Tax=Bacillaceae TaxID=186817 RepID=UPI0013D4F9C4|nr:MULTISPECIES: GNAT family N-acetyltransferase [Bacillaceae]MCS0653679.1 GNAT family N-acetyltransferase [Cytobacillus firmus]MCU1806654.1 GNAT family N-acetyltransferase [Cytobacillus firmus]WHY32558.1 GNAT family N-acetyltransferase [Cytobacillus firmus]